MKKIFTSMAVALMASIPAFAGEDPNPPVEQPSDMSGLVTSEMTGEFKVDGSKGVAHISFSMPTQYMGQYDMNTWTFSYGDLPEGSVYDTVKLTRSCGNIEQNKELKVWSNVKPGETLELDDSDFPEYGYTYGYSLEYTCFGFNGFGYLSLAIGYKPQQPEVSVKSSDGNAPVRIEVTVKSNLDENDNELPVPITKIVTTRRTDEANSVPVVISTIDNPEIGHKYEFLDENLESSKNYVYTPRVFTDFGASEESASYSVFIGEDFPGNPGNLVCKVNAEGGVDLTWEAPATSLHDGKFDPAKTRYKVFRRLGSYNAEAKELASDLTDTSFSDPCTDLETETNVYYMVSAYNEFGNGGSVSDYYGALVGPAKKLPFYESFDGGSAWYKQPLNLWQTGTTSSNGYCSMQYLGTGYVTVGDQSYYPSGVKSEGGVYEGFCGAGYSAYSSPDVQDYIVSGKLDKSEFDYPVISFYYMPVETDCTLRVDALNVSNPDDAIVVYDVDLKDGVVPNAEPQWKKVNAPMEGLGIEDQFKIRFIAGMAPSRGVIAPVYFDEIKIENYPGVAEESIAATEDDQNMVTVGWNAPESDKTGAYFNVYVDGEKAGEVAYFVDEPAIPMADGETPVDPVQDKSFTFSFQGTAGMNHIIGIQPVYMDPDNVMVDVPSRISEIKYECGKNQSGISCVLTDRTSTEYFNLQGLRVEAPAKGDIVVKRSLQPDGKVKMEKVVVD